MLSACCCTDTEGGGPILVQSDPPGEDLGDMPEAPAAAKPAGRDSTLEPTASDEGEAVEDGGEEDEEALLEQAEEGTFGITIPRSKDGPIGLDIDLVDDKTVYIVGIKEAGAIREWNDENPGLALQAHDRIVEVNGARDSTNSLVSRLKADSTWDLTVQRPSMIEVSVKSTAGVELRYAANGSSLAIASISDGPLDEWNRLNLSGQEICKHDRIVEVNTVRGGSTELLRASQGASELTLVIAHYH